METGIISILAKVMKREAESLWLAGRRVGEDSLELELVDEDSVKMSGGGLGLGAGEEGCDFKSGFGDLGKRGDLRAELQGAEAILGEFLAAEVDGARAGDPWR